MSSPLVVDLPYTGDFSLVASATMAAHAGFVGPLRDQPGGEVSLDLAFCLDGSWDAVGASIVQDPSGVVRATIEGSSVGSMTEAVVRQLRCVLSLDRDGDEFRQLGARDEVVANLLSRFPGVRPVLHSSPYEACARAIVMHRISRGQATAATGRICEQLGDRVPVGDRTMSAFPSPRRLADLQQVRGLSERKVAQLRSLGEATAQSDRLTVHALRGLDQAAVMTELQRLPGIGPFSAELVLIRGVGDADVFPRTEKSLHRAMSQAYHLGETPDVTQLEAVAHRWSPYRSWVGLLLRHLVE